MDLNQIIIKPVITEKSLAATSLNRYTFLVDQKSTKGQIKMAIEQAFNVEVEKVRTSARLGKVRRTGRKRLATKTRNYKKAIISVKKGQTIKAFEVKG